MRSVFFFAFFICQLFSNDQTSAFALPLDDRQSEPAAKYTLTRAEFSRFLRRGSSDDTLVSNLIYALCYGAAAEGLAKNVSDWLKEVPEPVAFMSLFASPVYNGECGFEQDKQLGEKLFVQGGLAAAPLVLSRLDVETPHLGNSESGKDYAYRYSSHPSFRRSDPISISSLLYSPFGIHIAEDDPKLPESAHNLIKAVHSLKYASADTLNEIGESLLEGTLDLTQEGDLSPRTGRLNPQKLAAKSWITTAILRAGSRETLFRILPSIWRLEFLTLDRISQRSDSRIFRDISLPFDYLKELLIDLVAVHHSSMALELSDCILSFQQSDNKFHRYALLKALHVQGIPRNLDELAVFENHFSNSPEFEGLPPLDPYLSISANIFMSIGKMHRWEELKHCGLDQDTIEKGTDWQDSAINELRNMPDTKN